MSTCLWTSCFTSIARIWLKGLTLRGVWPCRSGAAWSLLSFHFVSGIGASPSVVRPCRWDAIAFLHYHRPLFVLHWGSLALVLRGSFFSVSLWYLALDLTLRGVVGSVGYLTFSFPLFMWIPFGGIGRFTRRQESVVSWVGRLSQSACWWRLRAI